MKISDIWKDNMIVIVEIGWQSRTVFICQNDLEDPRFKELLKKESMKLFVISDDVYKRMFDLSDESLREYKSQFEYYENATGLLDDLFNQFCQLFVLEGRYVDACFLNSDVLYGILSINSNDELVFDMNPSFNKNESREFVDIYKQLYNCELDDEEAFALIEQLRPEGNVSVCGEELGVQMVLK